MGGDRVRKEENCKKQPCEILKLLRKADLHLITRKDGVINWKKKKLIKIEQEKKREKGMNYINLLCTQHTVLILLRPFFCCSYLFLFFFFVFLFFSALKDRLFYCFCFYLRITFHTCFNTEPKRPKTLEVC